jgi:outer membrane protein assembly factor BamB
LDERAARPDPAHTSAAARGIAVWADARGRLTGIDPATARTLWSASPDGGTPQDVTLWEHGLVVASANPPALCLLNPFDGEVLLRAGERQALGAPAVALDSEGRLCYAMGSTVACYDARRQRAFWTVRIPNFTALRVWAAGTVLVAHGVDARGGEVFECRSLATGDPVWSLAVPNGETLRDAALEADAFYVVGRVANRVSVRRIETSTGKVAWTHELGRGEDLGAWEPSPAALCLGITATGENGPHQALVLGLDKLTGARQQRLALGRGELVSLTRLGASIYAVFREDPRAQDAEAAAPRRAGVAIDPMADALLERPQFRIVRIVGSL